MREKMKFRDVLGSPASMAISMVSNAIIRYMDYTKMLDRMIKNTENAVAFLEGKKKKLQDKKKAESK